MDCFEELSQVMLPIPVRYDDRDLHAWCTRLWPIQPTGLNKTAVVSLQFIQVYVDHFVAKIHFSYQVFGHLRTESPIIGTVIKRNLMHWIKVIADFRAITFESFYPIEFDI